MSVLLSAPDPAADRFVATMVLALQRAAYAVEALLVGDERLPPLQEDEEQLVAARSRWVMAWDGVELVGAIAWSRHEDQVTVEKLMVAPTAMRRGIGTMLMGRLLAESAGRQVEVSTGRDNAAALALYAKHGFVREADEQVPPGIWVTRLRLSRHR